MRDSDITKLRRKPARINVQLRKLEPLIAGYYEDRWQVEARYRSDSARGAGAGDEGVHPAPSPAARTPPRCAASAAAGPRASMACGSVWASARTRWSWRRRCTLITGAANIRWRLGGSLDCPFG